MADPDFLYATLDTTAYAAFIKESRMNLANATKLYRKSGGRPSTAFAGCGRRDRLYRLRKISCFVSGHGFSRAVKSHSYEGFSP
jgi:hypothetical protein